ncbi:MAG: tetratricopeptide repeat protein [Acidobacteria bacterium]|nr:tetratricopeptide repeat protein [Acidobacteriota bacterium]
MPRPGLTILRAVGTALGLLLLLLAVPLAANDPTAQGWDHFYNLEYPQAIASFEQAIAASPEDPSPHNFLAQSILYQELYRLGALESEILTGNNYFIRTEKIRPDRAAEERFRSAVDKAIQLAQARLKANPNDETALYALGSSYAMQTNYDFMVQKAWRSAVSDISQARKYHNRVVELDPQHYDAMLTQGVYDYALGSLPWHARLLSFLIGRYGDKNRGIQTIELVARQGKRNRVDAQVMLAIIYRRERRPAKAVQALDPLIQAYPRNYLFRMEKAHMYSDLGNKEEALKILREVEQMALRGGPAYSKIPLEKVYYAIGDVQFWYNDLDRALENMRRVTRYPELDLHTGVLAWMRLGQIFDLTQRRAEAVRAYKQAIQFAPQTDAAQESRRYLSSPYRRKG